MKKDERSTGSDEVAEQEEPECEARLPERFLAFLREARTWRQASVEAEADYFFFLLDNEARTDVWKKGTGYVDYEQVITRWNLTTPERYAKFKSAAARIGREMVRAIGVDQVAEIVCVPPDAESMETPGKTAFDATLDATIASRMRNGVSPSPRQVASIRGRHWTKPKAEALPKDPAEDRVLQLEAENAKLRRDCARLQRQLDVANRKVARAEERWANARDRSRSKKQADPSTSRSRHGSASSS